MNSTTPIVIDIQDYNDNYPEFHGHNKSVYTVFVREDTSINTNLKSFGKLIDKDSRENGAIDLTIVNGDVCLFTVNRVDEELFLKIKLANITLDYEKGPQHNTCIIKATDRGVNKLSSTATLSISITDVNDNAPHINNTDIIKNLSRDAVSKTVVVDSIPATDIDSGENGMILYEIALSAHSSRFIIDPATGNITVNTPLLSVQKDEIQLTVIVSDKGVPSLSATAQVTIRLQDDNPRPYFEKSENVTIQEHTPILNGILAKIKAYDRRDGVISVCDCLYLLDTDRNDIIIENDTGVIKFIHSDYTLDREEEIRGHIIIGVIAIDKGEPPKESPTMEFKIIIKDINDQVPVFTKIHYTFEIFQHAPNGFNIGKVVAVDLDENPETLYSINITESSVGSVVEIDNSTGKIVKSGNMSLSSAQNVQMKGNVFAQDGKDLKKSRSHAEITITIEFDDKNNHTPVFEKSEYNAAIDWNLAAGYKIVDVVAEDADVGKEGNITYSIIDGNTRGFFSINSSGAVLLKYQLDSSIGDKDTVIVELIVKAEDKGIIPKNSNASVIIRISGKNPGTCIQGAEHSKQLLNIESERDNWSYALYGLVGALCLAILMSFAFLYKWRTSPVSETTPPVGKMKYFDNPIPYDHLKKRETVEYSHSNESFDPPSRNCDFSDDKDQYQRVTEPEGEARYRRPPDNKHLHSSRPLSFEEPTPDYPVYEFEGKVTKPTIPSTSRTSENC
ncbi:Hypothetical predicted protein [Mytilus galloprovincialis]|uniref:Cadherin domain-containing protein n=1 Tax=Mytilus galloprovincialis TaxID=29158 RepID=A0A8B6DKK2_MYTGA|nr:Hypothetical predicted protein [Mytilus galloprovincialis]